MKIIYGLGLALLVAATGCSTSRQVATMRGQGARQTFNAPFDATWRAAVDAAQHDGLRIINADRSNGYIATHRTIRPQTFGENVGIWVTPVSPSQTAVEVVSRQAGPPVAWFKNWQNQILQTVAADLTREVPTAAGGAPTDTYTIGGAGASLPAPAQTLNQPATSSSFDQSAAAATTEQGTTSERIAQEQRRLEQLRKDIADQRDKVSSEIERLRGELQQLQNRLSDVEKEQNQLK